MAGASAAAVDGCEGVEMAGVLREVRCFSTVILLLLAWSAYSLWRGMGQVYCFRFAKIKTVEVQTGNALDTPLVARK